MNLCAKCSMVLAVADVSMLRHWIAQTGSHSESWNDRLGNDSALVCPRCDAYSLGAEFTLGVPFHAPAVGAWLTVNDWDWWNRDPAECDIRNWPAFGCLSFSEDALRTTVEYLREVDPNALNSKTPLALDPELVGPTGIPEDKTPESEWAEQLRTLHERMRPEFSARELDVTVRMLVCVLLDRDSKRVSG